MMRLQSLQSAAPDEVHHEDEVTVSDKMSSEEEDLHFCCFRTSTEKRKELNDEDSVCILTNKLIIKGNCT